MVPAAVDRVGLGPAAALFRSLADPARLAIVAHLAGGEARVVDLTERLGLAQSTVSKHLACLRDCGLVQARAVGRASVYSTAVGLWWLDPTVGLLIAALAVREGIEAWRGEDRDC